MSTNKTEVVRLIARLCRGIVPNFSAMNLSLCQQIKHVKSCLEHRVYEDDEILLGLLVKFKTFLKSKDSDRLLRHILKKYRSAELKQQLKKAEDENLMLLERNASLMKDLSKEQLDMQYWRTQTFDARGRIAEFVEENTNVQRLVEAKDTYAKNLVRLLEAYGEGLKLADVSDDRLKWIGIKLDFGALRWKREHLERQVRQTLGENPTFVCTITQMPFINPVMASDGNTYEKDALVEWIGRGGNSPLTREPISIVCENRALKNVIDAQRASLEKELYAKCELPRLQG
jgi:hypothetical protein